MVSHARKTGLLIGTVLVFAVPEVAHTQVYRCTTPEGQTVLSDKECEKGARKSGHGWVDVEEDRRQRLEQEQSRLRAAERARQLQEQRDRQETQAALTLRTNPPPSSKAVQVQNLDRLTSYGVLLGRALGCGIPTEAQSKSVGRWMDSQFSAAERAIYLPVLMEAIRHHANEQRHGRAPDTCAQVRQTFYRVAWP